MCCKECSNDYKNGCIWTAQDQSKCKEGYSIDEGDRELLGREDTDPAKML